MIRVGIDTGGTFTDLVAFAPEGGTLAFHKVVSTPDDPARGIIRGIREIVARVGARAEEIELLVHGTTVATNAVLQRTGARVALITTAGFRDVLQIQRQDRPRLYDLRGRRARPLVPHALRYELRERVRFDGSVQTPLDRGQLDGLVDALRRERVEAVAVGLLHSYANPAHELEVGRVLAKRLPETEVCLSHEVAGEQGEYERFSTCAMNAFVQPVIGRYLDRLEQGLAAHGVAAPLFVMKSSGGVMAAQAAARRAVETVMSGPAGGLVAGAAIARSAADCRNLITADMGGTSFDVGVVRDGAIGFARDTEMGGLAISVPMLDIHSVGAGGGSIGWIDAGGALRVGPHSAGARPGPACYGLGGSEPTVTDANLVLGRLGAGSLLGGGMEIDAERARRAIHDRLAGPLRITVEAAAEGMIRVVNAAMTAAIRKLTVARGHDPREFALCPFGGAGPLHGAELAAELGIGRTIVPRCEFRDRPADDRPARGSHRHLRAAAGPYHRDRTGAAVRGVGEVGPRAAAAFGERRRRAAPEPRPRPALPGPALRAAGRGGAGTARPGPDRRAVPRRARAHLRLCARRAPGRGVQRLGVGRGRPAAAAPAAGAPRQRRTRAGSGAAGAIRGPRLRDAGLPARRAGRRHDVDRSRDHRAARRHHRAVARAAPGGGPPRAAPARPAGERLMTAGRPLDPVTLEIMRNRWKGIAEECCAALVRASHSTNIKDRRDCSVALALPSGEIVAQAEVGTPLHLGVMPGVIRAILARYPVAQMQPGDVYGTNLPYPEGPGHLPDLSLASPIFHDGRPIALAASAAHHVDMGGYAPGSMPFGVTEIYQEGLQIPPLPLVRQDRFDENLLRLIEQNVRTEYEVRGDLMAQYAVAKKAEQRVTELLARVGAGELVRYMAEILDHAERCMRAGIAALPDGTYRFEDFLDDDGVTAEPVKIAVAVRIAGDELSADFSGSSRQVLGPLNARISAAQSAVYYTCKAVIDPDLPTCAGSYRPIHVHARRAASCRRPTRPPSATPTSSLTSAWWTCCSGPWRSACRSGCVPPAAAR